MRKPVYAICEQQRCRSACTSAQSDQRLCYSLPSVIPPFSISEISSLQLASVAEQASLSLTWSQNWKTGLSCCLDSIISLVSVQFQASS